MSKISLLVFLLMFFVFACKNEKEVQTRQYIGQGKMLFEQHCASCHGENGEGFKSMYPPVMNSSYVDTSKNLAYILKNGIQGEIVVNNKTFNQAMPANPKLEPVDIARLLTYIHNFDREKKDTLIQKEQVVSILEKVQ